VYCRVSTDERLHQSFNSIDAQKEAGLASVASQRAEGWIPVADDYIDPGFSGGNLERPGLKCLLAGIEAGKIDRLTRSLTDFSRLIEVFERNKVSFVAVTVHAILAENNRQRASETLQRRQPEAMLLGLFYAQDGERFQPAFTRKANGKMYRNYVPIRKVRFGAKATGAGRLPAEPIEQLVLAQVHAALKAPEVVQSVCDKVAASTPEVTEPEVVLALRHLGNVWEQLFPAERQRIVQLLIERVTLRDEGIEINWRDVGWATLVGEMLPGTIGAELAEVEQMQEALA
jgi:hypothetical protein